MIIQDQHTVSAGVLRASTYTALGTTAGNTNVANGAFRINWME